MKWKYEKYVESIANSIEFHDNKTITKELLYYFAEKIYQMGSRDNREIIAITDLSFVPELKGIISARFSYAN